MQYLLIAFLCLCNCISAINVENLLNRLQEPMPQWMRDQIQQDLSCFTEELGQHALNALFHEKGNEFKLVRVTISKGNLSFEYCSSSQNHCVTPWIVEGLKKLHQFVDLPDVDFLFTVDDAIRPHNQGPIFGESKIGDQPGILFPDRWALKGYIPEKTDILKGNQIYPWESKIPRLFFRGSDTARDHDVNWANWDLTPRVLAVRLSNIYPELIDAKFFQTLHNKAMLNKARKEGLITDEFFSLQNHPRYKYLLDLDGNCASCPRTAAIFHSNSLIFKEVSPSHQWWYGRLKAYEHFIPFSGDLSDLLSQLEWAKNHDDECRKISENAQRLAAEVLSEESIYQFLYELIVSYANKQRVYY